MDGPLLTVAEIAELLRVNPQTVRNWIDRGDLPALRVGSRRVRVKQADLDEFLVAAPERPHRAADLDQLRIDLGASLESARTAIDGGDEAALRESLPRLVDAATRLRRALDRAR